MDLFHYFFSQSHLDTLAPPNNYAQVALDPKTRQPLTYTGVMLAPPNRWAELAAYSPWLKDAQCVGSYPTDKLPLTLRGRNGVLTEVGRRYSQNVAVPRLQGARITKRPNNLGLYS